MRVFSNAWVQGETGDLLGYELAIKPLSDRGIDALLYLYEGGASDGIQLPGRISGKHVTIEGNWNEHLTEYPSKREIVQVHFVKIEGELDSTAFLGKMSIKDMSVDDHLRLKRVRHIWLCKK
jgi:hypothetical protein